MPNDNLAWQFLLTCKGIFGSMSGGENPRWIPFLNGEVTYGQLIEGCYYFNQELQRLNSEELPPAKIPMNFAKSCDKITSKVWGAGGLSSQSMLHNAVHTRTCHDSRYGEQGYISTSTKSFSHLVDVVAKLFMEQGYEDPENEAKKMLRDPQTRVNLVTAASVLADTWSREAWREN